MSVLPDHANLDQLRTQAKELKRAALAGDRSALDRILAHHPKFADLPPERLEGWQVSLRDAQVTLARELGFDSWRALLAEIEGDEPPRWNPGWSKSVQARAFEEAEKHGQHYCTEEHFLLALLSHPQPTAASAVLTEVGLSYEQVEERTAAMGPGSGRGVQSTPRYQLILGTAHGLALGLGSSEVADEHVLLAIVYSSDESGLFGFDIDPDDVIARLRARGVPMPLVAPPVAQIPMGPMGEWVYFPLEDFAAVTQEITKAYPPGTARWGTNRSKWKSGYWYVHGEEIPMRRIVESAAADPSAIEALTNEQGLQRENAAAPTLVDDQE